jgi:transposase
VIKLKELIVILDLYKEGLTVSAIAERTGLDRKTVRKYIERGVEAPQYGPPIALVHHRALRNLCARASERLS